MNPHCSNKNNLTTAKSNPQSNYLISKKTSQVNAKVLIDKLFTLFELKDLIVSTRAIKYNL